jgi:iron complex outermembrane receptor protein
VVGSRVNVTGGGSPGAKADIRIRGGSSLNASNEPLIVLDGLPLSNTLQVSYKYFVND